MLQTFRNFSFWSLKTRRLITGWLLSNCYQYNFLSFYSIVSSQDEALPNRILRVFSQEPWAPRRNQYLQNLFSWYLSSGVFFSALLPDLT
jgi:hypothetical protein